MKISVTLPLKEESVKKLHAGDEVLLSGVIYSGRDQAHKRLCDLLDQKEDLPFSLKGEVIYYMGPTPAPQGRPIGSAGPTTSARMDPFAPRLLREGLAGMIGKGPRSQDVLQAINECSGVYFYAYGGCGALYAEKIKSCEAVAFEDLGPEAVYRLEVEDFPVIVAVDAEGKSIL